MATKQVKRVMGVLVLLSLLASCGTSYRTNGSTSTAAMGMGMVSGQALQDPPDLNAAATPNVDLQLVAARTHFKLAGRSVLGDSYNGSFVGPTLHLAPGQHVNLNLVNHLPVTTNLHFHGMHISPSGASDNPYINVVPGQSFAYHLDIPTDHPLGTFWYHDHGMVMEPGTAAMPAMASMPGMSPTTTVGSDVESQILAGLSGTIIVGDDRSLLPPDLRQVTAHTLVFKDAQIDRHGNMVQNTSTGEKINSNNPTVRLVNGQLRPVLSMHPGETQLWRLANEGADLFYQLHLDGSRFTVIEQDGRPVAQVSTTDTILLGPGKRYDVLVTAGPRSGQTWLRTLAYQNGPQGDSYPDVQLMNVQVAGQPQSVVAMASGAMPGAPTDLTTAPIAQYRTVVLSENNAATNFYINGEQFNMDNSVFSTPAVAGTVEEWTVINKSLETHPFHLHTNAFQVISVNGLPQPFTGWQDSVPVPYGRDPQVVLRIKFADFTGKWMFHCHIAAHEDNGMMSFVNVISP